MSSEPPGISASKVEVTNISAHGISLLAGEKEHSLSYKDFPWFKDASVGKILEVRESTRCHFFWPELDVDLGLETILHHDRFPIFQFELGSAARASTLRQVLTRT